ncbi:hypothetical protein [Nesterenkonia haasae]|uniref:hypothetical protein n=1 Tax=Nesterenkonia haasae TaxID=2587813 RepID=UPI001391E090|nr:hypothetical protein [Nesterenkonia haasae]NDK32642.1 hypothetical protein [Nesterenkonia haasae]
MRRNSLIAAPALSSLSLLTLTACGGGNDAAPEPEPEETTQTETETEEPTATVTETVTAESPDEEPTGEDDGEDPAPDEPEGDGVPPGGAERLTEGEFDGTIHGEETQTVYSDEGAEVGAAGFAPEDGPLVVHAEPTRGSATVGELGPLDAVELAGRERHHPEDDEQGSWTEIVLADGYGWMESGQIGHGAGLYFFGETQDITEDYLDEVPPTEQSEAIVESVAERVIGPDEQMMDAEGEPAGPDWALISSPEDTGEEFYRADVTGYLDDSLAGERLFITVEGVDGDYQLVQVERTLICQRGVGDDGLCL